MKPYRGKRTGPQLSRSAGFSFGRLGLVGGRVRAMSGSPSARAPRWECTFRGESATTASVQPSKPGRKVAPLLGGECYSLSTRRPARGARNPLPAVLRDLARLSSSDWCGLLAVRADRGGSFGWGPLVGPVLRVSGERSVSRPTRLETRTKESNACASHWALRNLKAK